MKIKIHLKDPDGVQDSREDAVRESLKGIVGISDQERDELFEVRYKEIQEKTGHFIEYGEYVTIEIDTETDTATVLRKN